LVLTRNQGFINLQKAPRKRGFLVADHLIKAATQRNQFFVPVKLPLQLDGQDRITEANEARRAETTGSVHESAATPEAATAVHRVIKPAPVRTR